GRPRAGALARVCPQSRLRARWRTQIERWPLFRLRSSPLPVLNSQSSISVDGLYCAPSLFFPAMVHADAILSIARCPRMIFQASLQLIAAYFAIARLLGSCCGVGTVCGKQHQQNGNGSHDRLLCLCRLTFGFTPIKETSPSLLGRTAPRRSVARGKRARQRDIDGHSSPQLAQWMTVHERVTQADIEGKFVVNLPDQSDEGGYGFGLPKLLLVEHLGDRSHGPLRWPLDDHASKEIGMMLAGERGGSVQMKRPPVPALRHDPGQTCAKL